jgi:hypothetical protein
MGYMDNTTTSSCSTGKWRVSQLKAPKLKFTTSETRLYTGVCHTFVFLRKLALLIEKVVA